ncbi:MAG TPA: alpha/beta fold hydrolase [Clostridia bacterium]|nr:alpha/beta fold hydrolase [Clostridia bacterium]
MKMFVYKSQECMNRMHSFYDKSLELLNVEYSDSYIQTSFGKTHIVCIGDKKKKPLFTLHGGNGISPLNIRLFLPLVDEYYIIAPDVIGMPGKSEPFRNLDTRKDDYGNWLNEILNTLNLDSIMFVVSSYSSAMMLSLAKIHPERISKAVLLVPSGIAHGSLPTIIWNMSIPFVKYYLHPKRKTLEGIMNTMVTEGDDIWCEFLDLMMTSYKMEMRSPREFRKDELSNFTAPVLIIASSEDVFFPDYKVFAKADKIFAGKIEKMKITGKHLPSHKTMEDVCKAIIDFDNKYLPA